ncbi:MAG: hypothetical protein DRH08_03690 [Deltaproteobacteria bacterium]|nr:MAG: hypothetical protein DRH08_03690 [Deltaproteobacteria bacterium]
MADSLILNKQLVSLTRLLSNHPKIAKSNKFMDTRQQAYLTLRFYTRTVFIDSTATRSCFRYFSQIILDRPVLFHYFENGFHNHIQKEIHQ